MYTISHFHTSETILGLGLILSLGLILTYLILQLCLELKQRVEEVSMQLKDPLYTLSVDLLHIVLLGQLFTHVLSTLHPLQPLSLLEGRLVHILLLGRGELEHYVQ